MANEDNTRQIPSVNGSGGSDKEQVLNAIRGLDVRLTTVEEIILARLNDTRPFEHKMMARLDELALSLAAMREEQAAMREEQAAMREEQAAMREDVNQFRQETNQNFRLINQKQGHLNNDFLEIRAEHTLLEKRVSSLEERAA